LNLTLGGVGRAMLLEGVLAVGLLRTLGRDGRVGDKVGRS